MIKGNRQGQAGSLVPYQCGEIAIDVFWGRGGGIIRKMKCPERRCKKRAKELLEMLTEYKPLAKIEEMEEANYNMVDNVLNNGAGEKAQKEENKKEQELPAAKPSLKDRLAEKKELVSDQGKDHESQENLKNSQREM